MIFVVALFCLGFFLLIRKIVIKPIAAISKALYKKDASGIAELTKSKTEFGLLSTLVIDSFSQNEILAKEVEIRKQSEQALKAALEEKETALNEKLIAEKAAVAKSQFLSAMSHEIRTPINGVIGIANLLMEEDLCETQKDYVTTLNFSAQHLLSLVSDILDFSKIEAGSVHFERTSFNLEKLCQHTFNLFSSKAQEKNLEYKFIPAAMDDYSLYGDATRLSQVITNLISNAIKFTEKGSVIFSYEIQNNNKDQSSIIFKVQDSGIGIAANKIDKIFESFEQADDSVTRKYGGTGLGLTISKKIVELQGGVMKVESIPGKGSAFIFSLTFDNHVYSDTSGYDKAVANTALKELPGMKILVAEDNAVNAMVLTRFLSKWKIESDVVNDGAKAVNMINKNDYDIILMDLQMPVMDGMEATKIIRQSTSEKVKSLNVVAFTADALVDTRNKLIEIGFDHYITKPFNPEQLFKYLEKHYKKAS
jgi:signal transduction histidine kinase/CheY-like chemotaxis protein